MLSVRSEQHLENPAVKLIVAPIIAVAAIKPLTVQLNSAAQHYVNVHVKINKK